MEVAHLYTKQRKDFGKHCKFLSPAASIIEAIPVTVSYQDNYVVRNPSASFFDTAPHMYVITLLTFYYFYQYFVSLWVLYRSEHEANTDRLITKNSSMRHVEGGWPKDVDFTEQSDVSRFRKKAEKDEDYKGSVKVLAPVIARCLKQNNTINIYEVFIFIFFQINLS